MKVSAMRLDEVLNDARIWRFGQRASLAYPTVSTGFPALDALLPGGGWPLGAVTEILIPHEGSGGLRLLMPALTHLSQTGKWLVWIAPPYLPYAPALAAQGINLKRLLIVRNTLTPKAALWALEQALRSGACSMILAWPARITARELRRLQLAAEAGQSGGVLFRSDSALHHASPAALRIRLEPGSASLLVHICKCRGGASARSVCLDWS
jgi:hypothetical protein